VASKCRPLPLQLCPLLVRPLETPRGVEREAVRRFAGVGRISVSLSGRRHVERGRSSRLGKKHGGV
jgi:hypothetical protein